MDDVEKESFVLVQVVALLELFYRVGNEGQRGAEIVRHIGKERQLGVRGIFQLFGQHDKLVALLFQLLLLFGKLGVQSVFSPKGTYNKDQ